MLLLKVLSKAFDPNDMHHDLSMSDICMVQNLSLLMQAQILSMLLPAIAEDYLATTRLRNAASALVIREHYCRQANML